ncbi:MAG: hypothetical protein ACRC1H_09330, partial [Caldilineaceae bacterium]
ESAMSERKPPDQPEGPEPRPIISDFQRRRALEEAVVAMGNTHSEIALREAAEQIAAGWPTAMILPVLAKHLETPSSQLRGGIARVAALLPHDEAVAAFLRHAGNRAASPQARVTAAMILERFLDHRPSPGILADLQSSDDAALQSLREAVNEGRTNRHVLLEYVTQMQQHGEEIAHLVLHHLDGLPGADRVELLRLVAQEDRPRVARAALMRLETLANDEPAALRALYALQFTLPPDPAQQVERALRKLQFRGHTYTPPPATGWRALLAPAEPAGHLWLWLVQMPAHGARQGGLLAGLLLHPEAGILHSSLAHSLDHTLLPAPAPLGALVDLPLDETAGARLLEAPFDLGRLLLRRALRAHWEGQARRPLSGEMLLENDTLWSLAPPTVEPALAAMLERPTTPAPLDEAAPLVELLLGDPAMAAWSLPASASLHEASLRLPGATLPNLGLPADEVAHLMLRELANAPARDEMVRAVAAGLWMQAV